MKKGTQILFVLLALSLQMQAQILVVDELQCNGSSNAALTVQTFMCGTPPFSFVWTTGQLTQTITNVPAGDYTVYVSDNSLPAQITVFSYTLHDPPLLQGYLAKNDVACGGGNDGNAFAVFSGGTGSLSYLWSTGDVSPFINNLTAGTYTVTVTDGNGCQAIDSATINEPSPIVIGLDSIDHLTCPGYDNGAIWLTISGGSGNLNTTWIYNNVIYPVVSEDLTMLSPGVYDIQVVDSAGCSADASFTILQPMPTFYIDSVRPVNCNNGAEGYWSIEPIGAFDPYVAIFSTGDTISTDTVAAPWVSGLTAGTYTCVMTASNGCSAEFNLQLDQPLPITASDVVVTDVFCYGASTGSIVLGTINGGNDPYTFVWNNGAIGNPLINVVAGNYTVTITDSVGCAVTRGFKIDQPFESIKFFPEVWPTTCAYTIDGRIKLDDMHVFWSPYLNFLLLYDTSGVLLDTLAMGEIRGGLAAGPYACVLINQYGCTASDTVWVESGPDDCDLLVIPNMVTPNADGFNDVFRLENSCNYDAFMVVIYDDMGKEVFESDDCAFSWDPLTARNVSNTVYYYYIQITEEGQVYEYKNSINIHF